MNVENDTGDNIPAESSAPPSSEENSNASPSAPTQEEIDTALSFYNESHKQQDDTKNENTDKESTDNKAPETNEPAKDGKEKTESSDDNKSDEPIKYTFDGVEGDLDPQTQAFVDLMAPTLNSEKVSNETFNALALKMTEHQTAENKRMWEETKNDPRFAGKDFDKKMAIAKLPLAEFGTEELIQELDNAGLMNNVHVIKFLSDIGGILGEGGVLEKGKTSQVLTREESLTMMYGPKP